MLRIAKCLALVLIGLFVLSACDSQGSEGDDEEAAVTFEVQQSEGGSVTVSSLTLPRGGFVAIHEGTLQSSGPVDVQGSIIGVSEYLEPGTHENVEIEFFSVPGLERPADQLLNTDKQLYATLHRDTNNNEIFDFLLSRGDEDRPYLNAEGVVVTEEIELDVDRPATLTFEKQRAEGGAVVISSVYIPSGGFAAIHTDALQSGPSNAQESLIGVSDYLEEGLHKNVEVQLFDVPGLDDEDLSLGGVDQTLYAMPYEDTNENQTFDFLTSDGSEDGPFLGADDEPVMGEAQVGVPGKATITFNKQESEEGTAVTVSSVSLSKGGFVAIHDNSLQSDPPEVLGSVVGVSDYLESGTHENIEIELFDVPGLERPESSKLLRYQTLYAMPHEDTNENQTYDFLTSEGEVDPAYVDEEGNPVVGPAQYSYAPPVGDIIVDFEGGFPYQNIFGPQSDAMTISKSTDALEGTYALKLEYSNFGETANGRFLSFLNDKPDGTFDVAGYDGVRLWYKVNEPTSNPGEVRFFMAFRPGDSGGGGFVFNGATSLPSEKATEGYSALEIPIEEFQSGGITEISRIVFTFRDTNNNGVLGSGTIFFDRMEAYHSESN